MKTRRTDETYINKLTYAKKSCEAKQVVSMDDGVVALFNFKPLKTTESQTFELRTESQIFKRDKSTRSWTWANLDWEGSLTADESSSTNICRVVRK